MGKQPLAFLEIAYSILSNWRRILLWTALGATVGVVLAVLLPTEYTATARVLPPQSEPSTASLVAGSLGSLAGLGGSSSGGGLGSALGLKNPAEIYIGLLKSRSVADKLITDFHLMSVYHARYPSKARKVLASHTDLLAEKEGFIAVSVTDKDRNRAADLANAYVAGLNRQDALLAMSGASRRRAFYEEQLTQEKDALADAEVDLKKTQEGTGVVQLSGQSQILLQRIAQVRAQITSHDVALHALSNSQTSANPEYQRVRSEEDALQAQLRQLQRPAVDGEAGSDLATGSLPSLGLTYVRKLREVKYHESLLELLARQYAAARMDEARSSPQVQVVDVAEPPDRKSGPPRALLILAFTVLGLLVGCMLVIARDLVSTAAKDDPVREQLARIRGLFRRGSRQAHA